MVPAAPYIRGPREVPADPIESLVARFGETSTEVTDDDLPMIEARCRLKAEGARWAAARRRLMAEGADHYTKVEPTDRDLIDRAKKLPDCFLWLNHPDGPRPEDLSLLDTIAGCFDAAAHAIALVRKVLTASDRAEGEFVEALKLLAEAQSALRAAVLSLNARPDKDQFRIYQWIRGACLRHGLYIDRYMRLDDAASPTAWRQLSDRIEALDTTVRSAEERGRQYQSSLKRIRHHLKPLLNDDGSDHAHNWRVVIDTVEKMVADGVPPSNSDIRDLLVPLIDRVPEMDLPSGFKRVLREIDRFLATRPAPQTQGRVFEPTADVRAVADLLRGTTLVLIGGVRRPEAHEALARAFELKEVDWVEVPEHESVSTFEPHIARPEVGLVLLAVRWSSHSYGDVKQFCDRYGKPLVRLPAGYNPNQVAVQVLRQCGSRLSA